MSVNDFRFQKFKIKERFFPMASIGIPGLIIILVVALLLFGPKKLPELGRSIGQTMKEFKKSTKEIRDGFQDEIDEVKEAVDTVKNPLK